MNKDKVFYIPLNSPLCSNLIHDVVTIKTAYELSKYYKVYFIYSGNCTNEEIEKYYGIRINNNLKFISTIRVKYKKPIKLSLSIFTKVHMYYNIKKLIKKNKSFDNILLTNDDSLLKYLIKIKSELECKIVFETHDIYTKKFDYSKFDFIFTTTESLKEIWLRDLNFPKEKIEFLHLAPNNQLNIEFKKYSSKDELKRLIYTGKISSNRGTFLLIDSLKYLEEDYVVDIYGGTQDELDKLNNYIKENNVKQVINLHGYLPISQLNKELVNLKGIMVAPPLKNDRYEYIAHTKVSDYLAYGNIIIASNLLSIKEILLDDSLVFDSSSPKDLSDKIQYLQEKPIDNLNIIAKMNFDRYKSLSYKNRIIKLLKCLNDI